MLSILVLGSGCNNCHKLAALCKEVVEEEGVEAAIEPITEMDQIHAHGVILTPGLVINSKVVSSGKIPTKETLRHWILQASN